MERTCGLLEYCNPLNGAPVRCDRGGQTVAAEVALYPATGL